MWVIAYLFVFKIKKKFNYTHLAINFHVNQGSLLAVLIQSGDLSKVCMARCH